MTDLTVAIISYNSGESILQGLSDVLVSDLFTTIIIDNNSQDNTVEQLCCRCPELRIHCLDQNIGYGRAANIAFKEANTRFVLLLNPDIEVTADDVFAFFKQAKSLDCSPAIMAPATNPKEYTCTGWQKAPFVLGAVMLFDLNELQKYGFFDEKFFLFYEEKDLCRRVVSEGGEILRLSDTLFSHRKGTSSGVKAEITYLKQWHVGWSSLYYLSKNGLRRGRFSLPALLIRYTIKRCFSLSETKRQKYRARLGGVIAFWRGKEAFDGTGRPRKLDILSKH